MANKEIANIFFEISSYLTADEVAFRPYAYRRAAEAVQKLDEDAREIYHKGGLKALEAIPGVGKNLALKIEEYLKTGNIAYYKKIKKDLPIDLAEITRVEGMGPKKARKLYQELKVKTLKDLEKPAKAGKLRDLEGFGEKTEQNILEGIAFVKRSRGRFLLGEIMPVVRAILQRLEGLKEVKQVSVAGSVRRMKETIGDVDILVVSPQPKKVMDFFTSFPEAIKVWGKGSTKASIRVRAGFDIDLRVVPAKSFGAALQYFTGSKEHNITTRKIAIAKGLKLNEYGVFRGARMIAGKTEEEVYKTLGLPLIPPELREDQGEVRVALQGKLPRVIEQNDMKGDLHCHSSWNGGAHSIQQMAQAAQTLGYAYIGIADHTKFLRIEKGLNEKQLARQRKEIDKLNAKSNFTILQGCESNIMNDGSIDIKDEALAKLDFVIAGIHSNLKMDRKQMTERMIKAMKNPHVDIIAHPTGRILQRRDEYQIDFDKILKVAKQTGMVLEINAYPDRLDLNDHNIRRAKEAGVKMIIGTDSHHKDHLINMEFGVAQARRGWAEKRDIVNTYPLKKLLTFFQ